MASLIPAVALAAALGSGPPLTSTQEPVPATPVVIPVPDADGRTVSAPPRQPETPGKVAVVAPDRPVASTPGVAVGRADEPAPAAAEQRQGGGRPGAGRGRAGAPRGGPAPVVVPRRGGFGSPGWWGPSPVFAARPYYYDPFWISGAFGWSPMFYAPWSLMWSTAGYGPYPWFGSTTFNTGGLRLKMKPRDAQVFVDGFYAGLVDDFDGIFQSLRLAPGGHKVEVRMAGFETMALDVHIQPDRTITWEERLRPTP